MSIERYEPRSPARRNSASVAHPQYAGRVAPKPKIPFLPNTKVLFQDDSIIEPPIGTVIKISGEHRGSYEGPAKGRRYDYAAIRASNGRWYTTGSTCPPFGYRWSNFLDFLISLDNATGERLC